MSKHRDAPPGRRRADVSRHRAEARPRYGRIATLGSSVAVMVVAVLGGAGVLPSSADEQPGNNPAVALADTETERGTGSGTGSGTDDKESTSPDPTPSTTESSTTSSDPADGADPTTSGLKPIDPGDAALPGVALPVDSGTGRRVVFSESLQRVWLVDDGERVERTYLVSGSIYDNLEPGTYEVYSRSEDAVGIENSGTMRYFVRFTQGDAGAAIGFHDIPIDDGGPVQTVAQLGTPLSHGCIRQKRSDAIALWKFAPLGTTVVVTA